MTLKNWWIRISLWLTFSIKTPFKAQNWRDVEKVREQGINKCFESREIKLKDFLIWDTWMVWLRNPCLLEQHLIYVSIMALMSIYGWLDWLICDLISGNNSNQRSFCFHFCIHNSFNRRWTGSHLMVATATATGQGISATPDLSLPQDWDWCNTSRSSSSSSSESHLSFRPTSPNPLSADSAF